MIAYLHNSTRLGSLQNYKFITKASAMFHQEAEQKDSHGNFELVVRSCRNHSLLCETKPELEDTYVGEAPSSICVTGRRNPRTQMTDGCLSILYNAAVPSQMCYGGKGDQIWAGGNNKGRKTRTEEK